MLYRIYCSKIDFTKCTLWLSCIKYLPRFYTKYEAQNTNMLYRIPIFYTKYQQHAVQNTNMLCKIPIFCTKYQHAVQNTNILYKIPTCCTKYQHSAQNTNTYKYYNMVYQTHLESTRGSRLESTWTSKVEPSQIHFPPVSTSTIGFRSCWLWNATTFFDDIFQFSMIFGR